MDTDPGTGGDAAPRLVAARDRVLADHREGVAGTLAAAAAVADGWDGRGVTDRSAVVEPLAAVLADRGIDRALVAALADAVDAAGYALRAQPVPAPPYLAVTSRGPVCRATVADGRIVVSIDAFDVDRSGPSPRYVLRDVGPEAALSVELRGRGTDGDGDGGGGRR